MATIYDLKPGFQALLRPACAALARAGVTANQVTVVAALLSVTGGAAILWWPEARWPLLLLPAVLFVQCSKLLGFKISSPSVWGPTTRTTWSKRPFKACNSCRASTKSPIGVGCNLQN